MKINNKAIWSVWGFKITHHKSSNNGLFEFEDLNPQTSFSVVLSRTDKLLLSWFFFISIFRKGRS